MKKFIITTIFVIAICICTSCSESKKEDNEIQQKRKFVRPENVQTEVEKKDDESDINVNEEDNQCMWKISNYTDEFGDPLSESFIGGIFTGTFCNTATTNSDLIVGIRVDKHNFDILLFEYGDFQVKNSYFENINYKIILKVDEEKFNLRGFMEENTSYISISKNLCVWKNDSPYKGQIDFLLEMFKNNNKVSFYIQQVDRPTTTYLFSVDTTGFFDLYALLNN